MRLLDLFCGAGGAAMGYHRAGFDEIVGVDIVPQPDYPFTFIQADAIAFLDAMIDGEEDIAYDLIHASPPCQRFSVATAPGIQETRHVNLVPETRAALDMLDIPYIIENVTTAPIRKDAILCGTMFGLTADGFELRRHRAFELAGFTVALTPPCAHNLKTVSVYGHLANHVRRTHSPKRIDKVSLKASFDLARALLDVPWMSNRNQGHDISEAIPPAYTEYLGRQFIAQQQAA